MEVAATPSRLAARDFLVPRSESAEVGEPEFRRCAPGALRFAARPAPRAGRLPPLPSTGQR
eukprot:4745913-Alexandrium_andersonii.AAC.1